MRKAAFIFATLALILAGTIWYSLSGKYWNEYRFVEEYLEHPDDLPNLIGKHDFRISDELLQVWGDAEGAAYAKAHFLRWAKNPLRTSCYAWTDDKSAKMVSCSAQNASGEDIFDLLINKTGNQDLIQGMVLRPDFH